MNVFNKEISCGDKKIGAGNPVFIVAEIGPNHNGDLNNALKLIDMAAGAGADAVKFQSFLADHLLIRTDPMYEWTKQIEIPESWYPRLIHRAQQNNLIFFSTATNEITIGWLEKYGAPMYKIASAHVNHLPIIKFAAETQKPIMLSTGFSYFGEIEKAVNTIRATGNTNLMVLHCVSDYPTAPQDVNLHFMSTLQHYFDLPIGFSDHTEGIEIAIAAAARGANVIEKHITLDKEADGPDHFYALLPLEFKQMVQSVRKVENALGGKIKVLTKQEVERRKSGRRTLHAFGDIAAGEILTDKNTRLLRPGDGLEIKYQKLVMGKPVKKAIPDQAPISWDCVC